MNMNKRGRWERWDNLILNSQITLPNGSVPTECIVLAWSDFMKTEDIDPDSVEMRFFAAAIRNGDQTVSFCGLYDNLIDPMYDRDLIPYFTDGRSAVSHLTLVCEALDAQSLSFRPGLHRLAFHDKWLRAASPA